MSDGFDKERAEEIFSKMISSYDQMQASGVKLLDTFMDSSMGQAVVFDWLWHFDKKMGDEYQEQLTRIFAKVGFACVANSWVERRLKDKEESDGNAS